MKFNDLEKEIKSYIPDADLTSVKKAFDFAQRVHAGQKRVNGVPYFTHLVETAVLVAKLKLDIPSIVSALLHDSVEDCDVTKEEIDNEFGPEVGLIVEGVTKLTRMKFESREEKQAESFRKMLVAMSKDIRVIFVKLCDRLHNMRTLQYVSSAQQQRKANETMEIYAPLANRLGINWLKSELEDYCLMYLRPELYQEMKKKFSITKKERVAFIKNVTETIKNILLKENVVADVKGRAKHFFSIWQKMESKSLSFDEIHDLSGFRILVKDLKDCYAALGIMHSKWKPVPGRFKDYIAMPKPNMYQSLHTTLIGPSGQRIEIQIRTEEMHRVAEQGIAAHWLYKEQDKADNFDLKWVSELVDSQKYLSNPDEFIQSVKGELFPKEVFVFTPNGDLIRLPFKSCPIDFAYNIHTQIGHNTTGAKVNSKIVPLSYQLQNGDTVEIITSKNHLPNKDWLAYVASSKAKNKIRAFLRTEQNARSLSIGIELLTKELRNYNLSLKKLEKQKEIIKASQNLGYKTENELYVELGYGKISLKKAVKEIVPENLLIPVGTADLSPIRKIFKKVASKTRKTVGVQVSGMDDIMVRYAKCCAPIPGERIVGFITRGRGVTVHKSDCQQALKADPSRMIPVNWDNEILIKSKVAITVLAVNRHGLLLNVAKVINDSKADIKTAQAKTTETEKSIFTFEVMIDNSNQLNLIIKSIEKISGIIKVERVKDMLNEQVF